MAAASPARQLLGLEPLVGGESDDFDAMPTSRSRANEHETNRVNERETDSKGISMQLLSPPAKSRWTRLTCALLVCGLSTACVTTITDSGPKAPEVQAAAQRNLGLDHLSNGFTAMAIRELTRADELDPNNPETLVWLGEAYRRKLRHEQALSFMERALAVTPENHIVQLNLSGLYIQLERYDEAIAIANSLVDDATYSSPWEALNNRGWAQLQIGQLDSAEASFEEALDYQPRYWPSRLNLGILAIERGLNKEAVDHFIEVLERGPDAFALAEANYRLGEVYVSWGHRDKAIGYFQAAFDESPNSDWGEQSKDYLDLLN